MDDLRTYIASGEDSLIPPLAQLERMVERYPWFTTARILRSRAAGIADPIVAISLTGKPLPKVYMRGVAASEVGATMEIIDAFLRRIKT